MRPTLILFILLCMYPQASIGQSVVEDSAQIGDTEIPYLHYSAKKPKTSLIWFQPHYGEFTRISVANALAAQGYEVWQPDLFEAFFLPRNYDSLNVMDGEIIAQFVSYVKQQHNLPVYLIGAGRGTVPALNGLSIDNSIAAGLIALNPSIYAKKPEALKPALFVESARRCNSMVMIIQPAKSTRIWWMDEVERTLRIGGANVQSVTIPDVRDGFWQRSDVTNDEISRKQRFHWDIIEAIKALEPLDER